MHMWHMVLAAAVTVTDILYQQLWIVPASKAGSEAVQSMTIPLLCVCVCSRVEDGELAALSTLQHLHTFRCQILGLPDAMWALTQLRELQLKADSVQDDVHLPKLSGTHSACTSTQFKTTSFPLHLTSKLNQCWHLLDGICEETQLPAGMVMNARGVFVMVLTGFDGKYCERL